MNVTLTMPDKTIWYDDGDYRCESLTTDKIGGFLDAVKVLQVYEPLLKDGSEVAGHFVGISEHISKKMVRDALRYAKQGISIIAVHKDSGKVVGYAVNSIENIKERISPHPDFKSPILRTTHGIYIQDLGVVPQHRRRRLASNLCISTMKLGHALRKGEEVKVPITNDAIPDTPVSGCVFAQFVTDASKRMAMTLPFRPIIFFTPKWIASFIIL